MVAIQYQLLRRQELLHRLLAIDRDQGGLITSIHTHLARQGRYDGDQHAPCARGAQCREVEAQVVVQPCALVTTHSPPERERYIIQRTQPRCWAGSSSPWLSPRPSSSWAKRWVSEILYVMTRHHRRYIRHGLITYAIDTTHRRDVGNSCQ
jgi:hypothetical protein